MIEIDSIILIGMLLFLFAFALIGILQRIIFYKYKEIKNEQVEILENFNDKLLTELKNCYERKKHFNSLTDGYGYKIFITEAGKNFYTNLMIVYKYKTHKTKIYINGKEITKV